MDFAYSERVTELMGRLSAFMDAHVYPNEAPFLAHAASDERWKPPDLLEELKAKAKAPSS